MTAFFVTGSGTDVGKTFVTAGLIRHLRGQGRIVEALKPIVSGFDPAQPAGSDPAILLCALARAATERELAQISPWRFKAPLSPDMAADAEARAIDMAEVESFCKKAILAAEDVLLIEGVGGVMVPINRVATQLDLMVALDLPLIFVGGSYLGAISHTLSALETLRLHGLRAQAIAISETPGSSVDLDATLATLGNFVAAPLVALRRDASPSANEAAFAQLSASI
ncbi:MAG: dethiobiotin synthase [Methylocella sp.]